MIIRRTTPETCADIRGLVVSIDVLRAFTTAGYLIHYGAKDVILVAEVQEALALRSRFPDFLLLGEVDGVKVPEFDFGNSPSALTPDRVRGRTIVQRTTAGTQGVLRPVHAHPIFAAALTNLSATARSIRALNPESITLIETGVFPGGFGEEDIACADGLEALLLGTELDAAALSDRVINSFAARKFYGTHPSFPSADVPMAAEVDRFDFALRVERVNGLCYLRQVRV